MRLHDLILGLLAFVAELVGVLSGFGSSTFFVPAALLIEKAQFVLALTGILHCFGNIFKLFLFRAQFDGRLYWKLAFPAILLTAVGAWVATLYSGEVMERWLGGFLILVGASSLARGNRMLRAPRWVAYTLSALSGFSTGFVGTGGALRGLALVSIGVPKESFVAISSAVDIGGDFARTSIYLTHGFMDWSQWFYLPVLGAAAYGGARVGQRLLSRIPQAQFERIVALCIVLAGFAMLF